MKNHLWTFALLALSLALYSVGMVAGAAALLALGFAAELAFWVSLFWKKTGE